MKKYLAWVFVIPLSLLGEDLTELITLSKENKMIDVSKQNLESTRFEYDSVKEGYLPNFSIGATYEETSKETGSTPDNMTSLYGKVDFVIYDGGKRENTFDSYKNSIQSGTENLKNVKNQIALQVINYYYTYLSLVSQKEAKIKELEQLGAQQKRLKRFLEVGTATADEVQKIISRVASSNVDLHEIELKIQTILHNLEYTVGKTVSIQGGSKINEFTSTEQILRSDIKALEYEMQTMLYNAKSKKSGYYPTLSVSDTYYSNDLNYETTKFSGNSADYEQNVVGVNLSWDIFNFGSTSDAYNATYRKYLALKSQYEYEKNKASVDLKLSMKAFEIAKLKIESAKAGVQAADSAYESIKAKFQNGLADNIAYLEALSEKYLAQSVLNTAIYDLEIKKADIIYHSGRNLEEFIR
jgi:outer membrane protein